MQDKIDFLFWTVAFAFIMAFSIACLILQACSPALTPAQEGDVEHHETTLSACREQALKARAGDASPQDSYAQYEACKKDGGI